MSFYHEVQLQEIMGGNFVIVNEDLLMNLNTSCIPLWKEASL